MNISGQVAIRLTEYDKQALEAIAQAHPHIPDLAGLAREAWHQWYISATDENSKGKRLERIEETNKQILERLLSLENKVERLTKPA